MITTKQLLTIYAYAMVFERLSGELLAKIRALHEDCERSLLDETELEAVAELELALQEASREVRAELLGTGQDNEKQS